ncbi:hypothetical protein CB1_000753008 [Camelus ferus]|nr:hypothetical protein CB1_000753008 [Camelus ferus]
MEVGSKVPGSTAQASFVCQRCSQPPKVDCVTTQEPTAPLLAPAQVKPGETQREEASSGKDPFVESRQDDVSQGFIPLARMMSAESADLFTLSGGT